VLTMFGCCFQVMLDIEKLKSMSGLLTNSSMLSSSLPDHSQSRRLECGKPIKRVYVIVVLKIPKLFKLYRFKFF